MAEKIIEIERLKVTVNGNNRILNIEDGLEIDRGDVVGVIGANGAGKTTLINCIIDKMQYKGEIRRGFTFTELGIQFQRNSYNKLMKVYELIQIVIGASKSEQIRMDRIREFDF